MVAACKFHLGSGQVRVASTPLEMASQKAEGEGVNLWCLLVAKSSQAPRREGGLPLTGPVPKLSLLQLQGSRSSFPRSRTQSLPGVCGSSAEVHSENPFSGPPARGGAAGATWLRASGSGGARSSTPPSPPRHQHRHQPAAAPLQAARTGGVSKDVVPLLSVTRRASAQ